MAIAEAGVASFSQCWKPAVLGTRPWTNCSAALPVVQLQPGGWHPSHHTGGHAIEHPELAVQTEARLPATIHHPHYHLDPYGIFCWVSVLPHMSLNRVIHISPAPVSVSQSSINVFQEVILPVCSRALLTGKVRFSFL